VNASSTAAATCFRETAACGVRVIAWTSVAESLSALPEPAAGARPMEVADLVLDMCAPPADALVTIGGLDTPIGPGSPIDAVAIVNAVKVRTAELFVELGATPPVITRASAVGTERSRALFEEAYLEHARRLACAIDQRGGG
jgi:uncharacterized phosphosugar-binding protein